MRKRNAQIKMHKILEFKKRKNKRRLTLFNEDNKKASMSNMVNLIVKVKRMIGRSEKKKVEAA